MAIKAKTNLEDLVFEVESDEKLSFNTIVQTVTAKKRFVIKVTAGFFLFGLLISLISPEEFTSRLVIMPETQEGSNPNGILGQLGNLTGFSGFGSVNQQSLYPELYPKIVKSTPFYISVLNKEEVSWAREDTLAFKDYYESHIQKSLLGIIKKYTIGLPGVIKKALTPKAKKDDQIRHQYLVLTEDEKNIISYLEDRIRCDISKKTGLITIEVDMPTPVMSAFYANYTFSYMMKYITEYKLDKLKKNLDFLIERRTEAHDRYQEAQHILSDFVDRNSNLNSEKVRSEKDRLSAEYQLAFKMYDYLSQQVEQAKISVQEETPVFEVLEPVVVPLEKSKPKRKVMVIMSLFVGLSVSIGLIFLKELRGGKERKEEP